MINAAPRPSVDSGCAWWNFACKGAVEVANSGMSAITRSIASGAEMLLGQIVRVVDESSTVPLADPVYRHVYFGFLALAAPLMGIVLFVALISACLRRDFTTLGRAFVGVGVASLGGAFYIVFAQLLIAIDDWLAHGVVEVTGYNLTDSINEIAVGFHQIAGAPGEVAANMLLILLMLIMLVAGLILWFVLILRKMAILVVVAFAPLLVAGYLWAPTRAWVRRTTEVLVALVFTKTAIFTLFGIGLALMTRGSGQTPSDFVGTTVLMCGACFAPLVMLRLVHFAADTQLAGDAMTSLRGGVRPVTDRLQGMTSGSTMGRGDLARSQATAPRPDDIEPTRAGSLTSTPPAGTGSAAGSSSGAAAAASGAAAVAVGVAVSGKAVADQGKELGQEMTHQAQDLVRGTARPAQPLRGPDSPDDHAPDRNWE